MLIYLPSSQHFKSHRLSPPLQQDELIYRSLKPSHSNPSYTLSAALSPPPSISHLSAVLDALREDAVLVADAVAVGGQSDGGHRVQEAGSQPTEAAVTQTGVLLYVLQLLDVKTHLAKEMEE